MYVRCFTKTSSWNDWLSVKERLAIEIKQNCWKQQSFFRISKSVDLCWKEMIAVFYLVLQILKLYSYVVIANVIISWLVAFNILNTQNRFVYLVLDFTYRLTDPLLNKIRRFLPNLGALDISPIILLLLIWFIEMCMKLYVAPMIF